MKQTYKDKDKKQDQPATPQILPYIAHIQFEGSKKVYTFMSPEQLKTNDLVVVETVRGLEIGKVYAPGQLFDPAIHKKDMKPVIRLATPADLKQKEKNAEKEKEAMKVCQEAVNRLKLDMHLISSECTLDGSKIIFTYVSDDRVDFRQLLKELANRLSCRIELRQVGPRNKAKIVGGIGNCGMECCCSRFLNEFETVSINMAKNQLLALNISKLSGQCGKLMCCLRYENDQYTELKKGLPKINSFIVYNGNRYRITGMNVLQKQVKLENKEETLFLTFDEVWPEREHENEPQEEL